MSIAYVVIAAAAALGGYAFLVYPALLRLFAARHAEGRPGQAHEPPPTVTVTVPVHNEEGQIEGALESLLALEYPADRLRILIVSDGSSDRTEEIVRSFAGRGVELLALPRRVGKTAAEEAALREIRSEIVLNTDASTRLHPGALRALAAAFADPDIGVASGRDVSVGPDGAEGNEGESGYVGYEMRVRELETRVGGIVGASGCCYAIRSSLHRLPLPTGLSRDFAAALRAREHGYRAVSVDEATCSVPRTASLRLEYRRKVRTMVRGMRTLVHKRALLNPFRYGAFAWMLWSHKVARWGLPWAALAALLATGVLAVHHLWARVVIGVALALGVATLLAWARDGKVPPAIGLPAWVVLGNLAAVHATVKAAGGGQSAIWEPTRRDPAATAEAA